MTPLERAARALCEARGEDGLPILNLDPDFGDYPITSEGTSDLCPFTEADVLTLARAVLQAIREPSEAMLSAVIVEPTHLYDQGIRGADYQRDMKLAVASDRLALAGRWKDLIDAALEETS